MSAKIVEHRRLDTAKAEIVRIAFYLCCGKIDLVRLGYAFISRVNGQLVNDGPTGIPQAQQLRYLIVGFTGRIVTCLPELAVSQERGVDWLSRIGRGHFVQNCVPT